MLGRVSCAVALSVVCAVAMAQDVVRFGTQAASAPASGASAVAPSPIAKPARQGDPMPDPRVAGGSGALNLVDEAVMRLAPMTPDEVSQLREILRTRGEATRTNVSHRPPAKQVTRRVELDLSPGATPQVIRLSPGQGGVISFEDINGKPWPVTSFVNWAKSSGVVVDKFDDPPTSLSASVNADTSFGNIGVSLEGLPGVAVVFTVTSGQDATDYRVQMVVPRFLGGRPPAVESAPLPNLKTAELTPFLLFTPPANAKRLTVEGLPGAAAWESSPGRMVFRTDAFVTTQATAKLSSSDGYAVYEMAVTPIVAATVGGRFVSARVSGFTVGGINK